MTRSDMEGTNARRTAHEMSRILEDALNSLWDSTAKQADASAILTGIVAKDPDLIEPLMKAIQSAAQAQSNMADAQRHLRKLKEAVQEWMQGDSTALMDILGIERANEPARKRAKKTQPTPKADITETVEAKAVNSR